ncbi:hypothetical protein ACFLZW_07910, partial [Chloroflexota bacterium]
GIKIMPAAIAGDDSDPDSYKFSVDAAADEIVEFYKVEMAKKGWSMLAVGEADDSDLIVMMIFTKGSSIATINILSDNDPIIVLLITA